MLRILFLLICLAGAGLGIVYPAATRHFSGSEHGTYRVYDRGSGYMTAEAQLEAGDAPVRILVDMTTLGAFQPGEGETELTMTVASEGRTVLAETVSFLGQTPRKNSPQAVDAIWRTEAGVLDPVQPGRYVFTFGPGDAEGMEIRSVDMTLRSGASMPDQRAAPAGYILLAIGFIGLVNSFRSRKPVREKDGPPPPKWGRG